MYLREKEKEMGEAQWEREKQTPMQGSIPELQDHDPNPSQTHNWATQVPHTTIFKDLYRKEEEWQK